MCGNIAAAIAVFFFFHDRIPDLDQLYQTLNNQCSYLFNEEAFQLGVEDTFFALSESPELQNIYEKFV